LYRACIIEGVLRMARVTSDLMVAKAAEQVATVNGVEVPLADVVVRRAMFDSVEMACTWDLQVSVTLTQAAFEAMLGAGTSRIVVKLPEIGIVHWVQES
jgi:hypothetical protein